MREPSIHSSPSADARAAVVVPESARGRGWLLWAPVALYMAAIFFVSSLPQAPLPSDVSDKSAHIAAYTVLAILVVRALAGGLPVRIGRRTALLSLAITIGYGVSDEIHQMFVPGRSAELYDVCADAIGAGIGVGLCWAWGMICVARRR